MLVGCWFGSLVGFSLSEFAVVCVFCECCGLWVFSGCVFLNWLLDADVGVVWLVIWWWFVVLACIGCRLCLELFWVAVVLRGWVDVTCFFMFLVR